MKKPRQVRPCGVVLVCCEASGRSLETACLKCSEKVYGAELLFTRCALTEPLRQRVIGLIQLRLDG
jgi:hypothetical protein